MCVDFLFQLNLLPPYSLRSERDNGGQFLFKIKMIVENLAMKKQLIGAGWGGWFDQLFYVTKHVIFFEFFKVTFCDKFPRKICAPDNCRVVEDVERCEESIDQVQSVTISQLLFTGIT